MNWHEYERRKRQWERENPIANAQEHQDAMRRIVAQLDQEAEACAAVSQAKEKPLGRAA